MITASQRVLRNTLATYACSFLSAILAAFTGRWMLGALGTTDFGLYSLIGSLLFFAAATNAVLSGSASRHFAYAIGGAPDDVGRWFNAALGLQLGAALLLVAAGWPLGEYILARFLTVPADRLPACLWAFRALLAAACVGMVSLPFQAMFAARQRMAEPALWTAGAALLVFLLAARLDRLAADRLIVFAAGTAVITSVLRLAQVGRVLTIFPECRICPGYWRDGIRIRRLTAYAGWNLFSIVGDTLRIHGTAVLLNLQIGPRSNAAYGIADKVGAGANLMANSLINALSPELTTSEGRGARDRMLLLAQRAGKLSTLLVLPVALPLIAEMQSLLVLWLREPPAGAARLCQWMLAALLIDRLGAGTLLAVIAHGRIAAYKTAVGVCAMLTLPLAWALLRHAPPAEAVGLAFLAGGVAILAVRLRWMSRRLGVPAAQWFRGVLAPCAAVAAAAAAAMAAPRLLLPPGFLRLILVGAAGGGAALAAAWNLALDAPERVFVVHNARRLALKLTGGVRP